MTGRSLPSRPLLMTGRAVALTLGLILGLLLDALAERGIRIADEPSRNGRSPCTDAFLVSAPAARRDRGT